MNIWDLSDADLRVAAKQIKIESKEYPENLERQPDSLFENANAKVSAGSKVSELWRSRWYLCQVIKVSEDVERLSVCRTEVDTTNRRWRDGITWDELMEIKRQVGRGDFDAVEVLPRDSDIVNVANMRHVFVFRGNCPLPFVWRNRCNS